jgi:hypothetical protein
MTTTNADNGEAQNPVENAIGSVQNEETLVSQLRGILFSDEQDEGNPEPVEQEGEVQTEDKGEEVDELGDGLVEETESTPTAEDGDDVLSQVETDDNEQEQTGVQKRIDKLTALRKTAEEQVLSMKAELEEYKSKVADFEKSSETVQPTADSPFADLTSGDAIKNEYEQARQIRYKCEANPEGFQIGETYFDSEQVRNMKLNAMQAMEVHLPKQLEFVKAREQWKPVAIESYPWLKNKESNEYKLAQQVLKTFPQFKRFPDFELFIGDYVRGYTARTSQIGKKGVAIKQSPQLSVKPTSTQTQSSRNDASARSVESRFAKTGSREDLKRVVSKYL